MLLGRIAAAVLVTVSMVAACDSQPQPLEVKPVELAWREVTLPMPDGPPGRIMPRSAVWCGDMWYIVGAVGNGDETRPAAWKGAFGGTWEAMTLHPKTYYGHRNLLHSAGCQGSRLAAVGSRPGGAHGNPRVSTWTQLDDGSLDEVLARFELYGGPTAINVSMMAAGPQGWAIAGNRFSGAAVWLSADSKTFKILEAAPELAGDERGDTWAVDVAATPDGWVLVGGILPPGRTDRDPMAWFSSDGNQWQRGTFSAGTEYEELHRLLAAGGEVYAFGLRGGAFGVWKRAGDSWEAISSFSSLGGGFGSVSAATAVRPDLLLTAVSSGPAHELWLSRDAQEWRPVKAPSSMPTGADKAVSVAANSQRVVLLIDDGADGRVWWSEGSVTF